MSGKSHFEKDKDSTLHMPEWQIKRIASISSKSTSTTGTISPSKTTIPLKTTTGNKVSTIIEEIKSKQTKKQTSTVVKNISSKTTSTPSKSLNDGAISIPLKKSTGKSIPSTSTDVKNISSTGTNTSSKTKIETNIQSKTIPLKTTTGNKVSTIIEEIKSKQTNKPTSTHGTDTPSKSLNVGTNIPSKTIGGTKKMEEEEIVEWFNFFEKNSLVLKQTVPSKIPRNYFDVCRDTKIYIQNKFKVQVPTELLYKTRQEKYKECIKIIEINYYVKNNPIPKVQDQIHSKFDKVLCERAMIDVLEFFNRVDQLNVTEEDTKRFSKLSSQKKKYESMQIKKLKQKNSLVEQSIVRLKEIEDLQRKKKDLEDIKKIEEFEQEFEIFKTKEEIAILKKKLEKKFVKNYDSGMPDWSLLKPCSVELFSIVDSGNDWMEILNQNLQKVKSCEIKICENTFSSGSLRYSQYCLKDKELYVYKEPIYHHTTTSDFHNDLRIQFISQCFAKQFNKALGTEKVIFIETIFCKRKSKFGLIEKFIEGNYAKFTNNQNFCKKNQKDIEYLTAFSHFSFEKSNYELLIVDLQGVFKDDQFYLTDPALHCNEEKFIDSSTNFSLVGLTGFMDFHECNHVCKSLKLLPLK
jgi:hypothetical protein